MDKIEAIDTLGLRLAQVHGVTCALRNLWGEDHASEDDSPLPATIMAETLDALLELVNQAKDAFHIMTHAEEDAS